MKPQLPSERDGKGADAPRGSPERVVVIVPQHTRGKKPTHSSARSIEARLHEAVGLARAIELDIAKAGIVNVSQIRPATFLGKGKVEEIAGIVRTERAGLVFVDAALSPVQQRNLEKEWSAKVVDRTGLILEIFGERAQTREGTLQVELAHLNYQKSRLVRSWTHLERQRGGFGFLGGPGETQIETDRRMISDRIKRIEHELEGVKRTRELHRKDRRRVPYPIVALVGYTNAGKSTLFNRLTKAEVAAENMLFMTLDPTLRAADLPHGTRVIFSDTVGFISELPTLLIAAFRATLEEVLEADVILHVRDAADEDTEAQAQDVITILKELGINPDDHTRLIEVWNKIDLLDDEAKRGIENLALRRPAEVKPVLVSAVTGEGIGSLLIEIERRVVAGRSTISLDLDPADGAGLGWLHRQTEVLSRELNEQGRLAVTVRADPSKLGEIRKRFPSAA